MPRILYKASQRRHIAVNLAEWPKYSARNRNVFQPNNCPSNRQFKQADRGSVKNKALHQSGLSGLNARAMLRVGNTGRGEVCLAHDLGNRCDLPQGPLAEWPEREQTRC